MSHVDLSSRVLLLAGPTAVGKSAIALDLAEGLGGEIISVDSMQVYRGMDIGTAKPSAADRARVPHHLLDVGALEETFDAAQFVELARRAAEDILARGKVPILCGGTGLYFKAFLEGLGSAPPSDPALRRVLEQTPIEDLLAELAQKDPVGYETIDRRNPRRVYRAVEVVRLTGRPYSAQRADWSERPSAPSSLHFGLARDSEDLRRRIDQRVDLMFKLGLVDETRRLLDGGLAGNRTAAQALGYKQVIDFLAGKAPLPATVELVKARTRQFAKRQMTWFRGQMALNWIDIGVEETAEQTAARILEKFRRFGGGGVAG